jgi:hypothetical protein
MFLRLLTLLLLLVSTSGCDVQHGVDDRDFDVVGQEASLNDDSNVLNLIRNCNWYGILSTNETPVLRTPARQRTLQRIYEKRKFIFNALTRLSVANKILRIFCGERQMYSHLVNSGRSLLYFLCKLSI